MIVSQSVRNKRKKEKNRHLGLGVRGDFTLVVVLLSVTHIASLRSSSPSGLIHLGIERQGPHLSCVPHTKVIRHTHDEDPLHPQTLQIILQPRSRGPIVLEKSAVRINIPTEPLATHDATLRQCQVCVECSPLAKVTEIEFFHRIHNKKTVSTIPYNNCK